MPGLNCLSFPCPWRLRIPPRMIRSTRLVDLVNTMDPKLVAAAFGMDPQATLIYLADHVDPGRLPDHDKSS